MVLGIGADGKAHASRFEPRDQQFAARAAELMGFHVVTVSPDNDELHGVAAALPLGKIFATGRAFVPLVSRTAFDKLAPLVDGGISSAKPAKPQPAPDKPAAVPDTEPVSSADALWAKLGVGSAVLATQPEVYGPGWWEAVVVGVEGDDLTVRWVDDATEEPVRVSRRNVALRHPAAA